MINQPREFRRLGWYVCTRLMKLHGQMIWIMERAQYGVPPDGHDVDALYWRWFALQEALEAFKRHPQWRSVDVSDAEDFDDEQ